MRVRHKIPNVFSLSMMDVLCCALGCVILLWLLGAKQSEDDVADLREEAVNANTKSLATLSAAEDASSKLEQRLRGLVIDRDKALVMEWRLARQIAELTETRDLLKANLSGEQTRAGDLEGKLKSSLARVTSLEADVKARLAALDAERTKADKLDTKLAAAEAGLKATSKDLDAEKTRSAAAQKQLSDMRREIDVRGRDLAGLTKSLADAEGARKTLEGTLAARDKELTSTKKDARDRLDTAASRIAALEKDARDRAASLEAAGKAYKDLEQKIASLRQPQDKEGRFAGIALTGRRVIFLVDMSGSMKLVRWKEDAPDKWPEVCATVGRLMRSLTALEQYQVICFSTELTYPLGNGRRWLKHDPAKSPDETVKALRKVEPKGGTDLSIAVKEAFEYRVAGLDTVYLLSDGLPNNGEGVGDKEREKMTELDLGQALGRHILTKLRTNWNKADKDKARVKINTIGFFYESPDLGAFLWSLARENEGSFVGMSKP